MKNLTIAMNAAGLHPSTEACMEALLGLHEGHNFAHILDMGCGNAILSIAAAQMWGSARIMAADISPNALIDARQAIAEHGLQERISTVRSDGFSASEVRSHAPYDLIIANLLAETHVALAENIKKHLLPDGYCILSGMLAWLAEGVEQAYTGLGFEIVEKSTHSSWQCYVLRHTTAT